MNLLLFSVILVLLGLLQQTQSAVLSEEFATTSCIPFQFGNTKSANPLQDQSVANAISEVESYLETIASPGISFGIVYDQNLIYYKGFGRTDLSNANSVPNVDSIFRIGSISKWFTTAMAYRMHDIGLVNMDDPVMKYNKLFGIQTPWEDVSKMGEDITLRHLASQTSGLPRESPCMAGFIPGTTADCTKMNTTTILHRLRQQTALHPTDVQASYSNCAFAALGQILAEYENTDWVTAVQRFVLDPLKLNSSGAYLDENQFKHAATGYNSLGKVEAPPGKWLDIGWEGPAGQLFSSVRDLSKVLMTYFAAFPPNNDRSPYVATPWKKTTLRSMCKPVIVNTDLVSGYGTPWEMQVIKNRWVRSKGGNVPGFSTTIAFVPELRMGVIGLSNTDLDGSTMSFPALQILIPAFTRWIEWTSTKLNPFPVPTNPSIYEGAYSLGNQTAFIIRMKKSGSQQTLVEMQGATIANRLWFIVGTHSAILREYMDVSSCWGVTLGAYDAAIVYFQVDGNGNVVSATLPSSYYGAVFKKIGLREAPREWISFDIFRGPKRF